KLRDKKLMKRLRYVFSFRFQEVYNGLKIQGEVIDLKTGIRFAKFTHSASGRGFLRELALYAADQLEKALPYTAEVIRVKNDKIILNAGKAENYQKGDQISITTFSGETYPAQITKSDFHFSEAELKTPYLLLKIQKGNKVQRISSKRRDSLNSNK
ncbi:MAG: hypothetical protein D6767_09670, partial [Candidatus Hydrogenedentota bacterium]